MSKNETEKAWYLIIDNAHWKEPVDHNHITIIREVQEAELTNTLLDEIETLKTIHATKHIYITKLEKHHECNTLHNPISSNQSDRNRKSGQSPQNNSASLRSIHTH